jgi:Acyl-coenzyme A synthetases/AMP-(fatty) acid ligases
MPVNMKIGRDTWWHEEVKSKKIDTSCEPAVMDSESPLFMLYTSGTTGKPKGILHTTGGYLVYVNQTFKYIFDYQPNDIYWCTADVGWITGHSYLVYGPLSNGATILMFEGIPTYPTGDRFWQIIEKFKVSVFYTSPTAIRALAAYGNNPVEKYDLSSLRLLGTVGEPINPDPWLWYYNSVGSGKCPIVDTWWQTETGGILISPLPGATVLKPGSATKPFFGIEPAILNDTGKELTSGDAESSGYLVIKKTWPGCARTIYGDHTRYIKTYWSRFPGLFFTGDAAKCDSDGDYWLMGRVDDVIKVSGHRLGTAEVESTLVSHPLVAEAAVVSIPHDIKGEAIYAFVVLKKDSTIPAGFVEELRVHVGKQMSPIAKPDKIQIVSALPKTRSGKIVRRILKAVAQGKDDFGDTSTLTDPEVINQLIQGRVS